MKAVLVLVFFLSTLPALAETGQFVPRTYSDLPVRNVAEGGGKEASLALADVKCLSAANAIISRFEKRESIESLIEEAKRRVRGDLYPMPRFDRPIEMGIGRAFEAFSNQRIQSAWQEAFDSCTRVVIDADSYDWSQWFRDQARVTKKGGKRS